MEGVYQSGPSYFINVKEHAKIEEPVWTYAAEDLLAMSRIV